MSNYRKFKSLKIGKACSGDGVSRPFLLCLYYFKCIACNHCYLYILYITYGHLPSNFKQNTLILIIKNKTGNTSDKNNYNDF